MAIEIFYGLNPRISIKFVHLRPMERIEKLKQMLQSSPHDCFLLHALGLEYIKLDEIKTGIEYFEKVIAANENYVGTYYHLAKAYEKMGNEIKAVEIYENGIAIATKMKDNHARNELQMALEDLTF